MESQLVLNVFHRLKNISLEMSNKAKKHYKEITFRENRVRLRLLMEFRTLVSRYFDNSTLNMLEGCYVEKPEASEARSSINPIIQLAYKIIRLADVKTSSASNSSVTAGTKGQNIDLILNIFNLGRNNIPPGAALDYIDEAIDVYKSNNLPSLMRTLNPFFWIKVLWSNIAEVLRQHHTTQ
jgi:hypothetical protein